MPTRGEILTKIEEEIKIIGGVSIMPSVSINSRVGKMIRWLIMNGDTLNRYREGNVTFSFTNREGKETLKVKDENFDKLM